MRSIFYVLPILLLMATSCATTIKINHLESDSVNQRDNGNFTYEDDTIRLAYNFWKNKETLKFIIYNKSDKPIYISWKNSSFIYQGKSYSYWDNNEVVKSETRSEKTPVGDVYSVSISRIKKERPSKQIPPNSYSAIGEYRFNYIEPSKKIKDRDKVKTLDFTKEETPIHFRNYIAYSLDKDFDQLNYVDNEFWLRKINIMSPKKYEDEYSIPFKKNKFKLLNKGHLTRKGKIALGGIGGGLVALIITLAAVTGN